MHFLPHPKSLSHKGRGTLRDAFDSPLRRKRGEGLGVRGRTRAKFNTPLERFVHHQVEDDDQPAKSNGRENARVAVGEHRSQFLRA